MVRNVVRGFGLAILVIIVSCTARHVIVPDDPDISAVTADFSGLDLYVTVFSVQNLSKKDSLADIEYLKKKFIEYIKSQNDFRKVYDATSGFQPDRSRPHITIEVQITPDLTKERTYILDLPFFYPMCGYWPLTPLWGAAKVRLSANIFTSDGNAIKLLSTQFSKDYKIIFYSWYRTRPIEEAFKVCYKEVFSDAVKKMREENAAILSSTDTGSVKVRMIPREIVQEKTEIGVSQYQPPSITLPPFSGEPAFIAVIDFRAKAKGAEDLIASISDALREALFRTAYFKIVERAAMDAILKEQQFSLLDCTSDECIIQVGRLLSVDHIVSGGISQIGKAWYLSASIVNVESGLIEATASETRVCPKEDLLMAVETLAKKLALGYRKIKE
ncbi:MAG: hypothetical protein JSU92_06025 [Deltaproteobacteria bacterium]|nr:MAG: hypothetical protein JSU92_06025 [Deltaproteobacteria bacterium]